MYTVNLLVQKNRKRQDGTCAIYLQYNFSRERRWLTQTSKHIEPEHWDKTNRKVKKTHPNHENLNAFIQALKHKMEKIIDDAVLEGTVPTVEYVKERFKHATGRKGIKISQFFDKQEDFINSRVGKVSNSTIKDYRSLRKHLMGYEKYEKVKLTFDSFDYTFYDKFVYYLEYGLVKPNGEIGLQKNSVAKVIKNLKVFLRHAMRSGYCKQIDLSTYKVKKIKTHAVYVSEAELNQLTALDLEYWPQLQRIRDLFVIGCETGLRYSDLTRLTWDHIDESKTFIRMTIKKTLDNVVIPISPRLTMILYDYDTFERKQLPTNISMYEFNIQIKLICKMAGLDQMVSKWKVVGNNKEEIIQPKYQLISSHTCRRSFCTNQFLKGMPAILIRKISGHKKEQDFLRYIKIDEEEAAQKMIEYWKKGNRL